ncbi:DgyrCDS12462 [Dimorphilus gyrociliatus]|uniref:protein-tyrosine-phosphatase n=1 Tax=Dimorphilus gyrociliatus TaxID=2664684 RepID=A0A7I8W6I7_9ANNE|nr:DgyrCDS12462 [Dimorphilus gyrociliatus]
MTLGRRNNVKKALSDKDLSKNNTWLASMVKKGQACAIFDLRSPEDFVKSRIRGAENISVPTLMLKRLSNNKIGIASVVGRSLKPSSKVLLYENLCANSALANVLMRRLTEEGFSAFTLKGGFQDFFTEFPELCERDGEASLSVGLTNLRISSHSIDYETPTNRCEKNGGQGEPFPVRVLPNLFLGNASNAEDRECLREHKISRVVNVTRDSPNYFEEDGDVEYLKIPITDHWSENLCNYFAQAISFIDEGRQRKENVLVHCLAGISRSVTVTVAYLMHNLNLSMNDAYEFVRKIKPSISPNFNFMGQLLDFEAQLKSASPSSNSNSSSGDCSISPCGYFSTSPIQFNR